VGGKAGEGDRGLEALYPFDLKTCRLDRRYGVAIGMTPGHQTAPEGLNTVLPEGYRALAPHVL
jgi:hypothetical protein